MKLNTISPAAGSKKTRTRVGLILETGEAREVHHFALLVGYGGATLFARRLRRLEAAAERIAAGDFDEPVIDHGDDEVGQLARTFNVMIDVLRQREREREGRRGAVGSREGEPPPQ